MAKTKKTAPSVLAFEKKIVPSDGYMFETNWETRDTVSVPLAITSKSIRGTISNRLSGAMLSNLEKLDHQIENPNLQEIDSCSLSLNHDTLKLQFTLKILGDVGNPSACNDFSYQNQLSEMSKKYAEQHGFKELGKRYATSIANGRFLWRNRVGAEKIEVRVKDLIGKKEWKFDSYEFPIKDFDCGGAELESLGSLIASTLASSDGLLILDVTAYAKVGKSQEVYPSEEMVLGQGKVTNEKSKILYSVDEQAAMHSQKIGNAIRTIDTWYPEYQHLSIGPIAIEVYGAVTTLGKTLRHPTKTKKDFYTLIDDVLLKEEVLNLDDQHYLMAMLIRGGVFGSSSKE